MEKSNWAQSASNTPTSVPLGKSEQQFQLGGPHTESTFASLAAERDHWRAKADEYVRMVKERDHDVANERKLEEENRIALDQKAAEVTRLAKEKTEALDLVEEHEKKIDELTKLHEEEAAKRAGHWHDFYIRKAEETDELRNELKAIRYFFDLDENEDVIEELHRRLPKKPKGGSGTVNVRNEGPEGIISTAVLHLELAMSRDEFPVLFPWVQEWLENAGKTLYAEVAKIKPSLEAQGIKGLGQLAITPRSDGGGAKSLSHSVHALSSNRNSALHTPLPAKTATPLSADAKEWLPTTPSPSPALKWSELTSNTATHATEVAAPAQDTPSQADSVSTTPTNEKHEPTTPPSEAYDVMRGVQVTPLQSSWADFPKADRGLANKIDLNVMNFDWRSKYGANARH